MFCTWLAGKKFSVPESLLNRDIHMMLYPDGCFESVDHSTGVEWNARGQPKMLLNTSLSIGQKLEHAYSLGYWTRVAM